MTAQKPRVGFIGLGLMGAGFTTRLIECGYRVHGFDLNADLVARCGDRGNAC